MNAATAPTHSTQSTAMRTCNHMFACGTEAQRCDRGTQGLVTPECHDTFLRRGRHRRSSQRVPITRGAHAREIQPRPSAKREDQHEWRRAGAFWALCQEQCNFCQAKLDDRMIERDTDSAALIVHSSGVGVSAVFAAKCRRRPTAHRNVVVAYHL